MKDKGMNRFQAHLCLMCVSACWASESLIFKYIPGSVPATGAMYISFFIGAALLFLAFRNRTIEEFRFGHKTGYNAYSYLCRSSRSAGMPCICLRKSNHGYHLRQPEIQLGCGFCWKFHRTIHNISLLGRISGDTIRLDGFRSILVHASVIARVGSRD